MDLTNAKGIHINALNADNPDISRLSDLGENWEIDITCPNCNRIITFTKSNVNKAIICKCGQVLCIEIEKALL